MTDQGEKDDRMTSDLFLNGDGDGCVGGEPFWLDLEPDPIYGVLHVPRAAARPRIAALILPPFGCDAEFSYRPRRDWAMALAESGVAAARIDFPGTEDSVGSPFASSRFQSWVDATVQAAHWLRERTGCDRLVGIGIGLGGFVAYQAIAANAPIDDLVLWGVRATGRAYLRELRAFSAVAGEASVPWEDSTDGATWIGGHAMSAETAEVLSAVKLTEIPLPQAERRRVLLVGRDALGVDGKLRRSLEESGVALTVLDADDYHRLVAEPDYRWTPTKTISASIEWLQDSSYKGLIPINHEPAPRVPEVLDSVEFEYDGVSISERLTTVRMSAGRMIGIISEPTVGPRAPYCLVIINSGALRHTGPSRMLVEIARRAAASGVAAARFDLPGLGDSEGSWVRTFERSREDDAEPLAALRMIYDHLQELGIADRFVGTGLCLGAYFLVRATLEDERSIGAVVANIPAFRWTDAETKRGIRWFAALSNDDSVSVEPSGGESPGWLSSIAQRAARAFRSAEWRLGQRLAGIELLWRLAHREGLSAASKDLDQLGKKGASLLLLFGENETALRMLDQSKLDRWPNIRVERLPTHDHNLRPRRIQEMFFEHVSRALGELRLKL